jgi:type I restriction enzyme S subunit
MTITITETEELKMTELGSLPSDWEVVRLSQVLEEVDVRVCNSGITESSQCPVLSLTREYGLIPQTERFGKRIATKDVSNYKVVEKGQVVYNPYVIWEGAVHILRHFVYGLVSPVYPVMRVRATIADAYFVDQWLRMPYAISAYNRFAAGAVNRRRSIRKKDFLSIEIPLPSLTEQKRIAHVLSTVQAAIEKTEAVMTATRELKKSLMKHLFTYGPMSIDEAESVPLKETEIGLMPEVWEVVRLGDAVRTQYGYTTPACQDNVGPRFLRITDINDDGTVNWSTVPFCSVSPNDFRKFCLEDGDTVVARIGATTGKTYFAENPPPSVFASYLIRLKVKDKNKVHPGFIGAFTKSLPYWMQVNQSKDEKLKGGLSARQLEQIYIPLPSLQTQKKSVIALSALDKKLETEKDKKQSLEALFQTLLKNLMTGKIRVNNLEVPV